IFAPLFDRARFRHLRGRRRLIVATGRGRHLGELPQDLSPVFLNPLRDCVVHLQALLQTEEMILAPVTSQLLGDLSLAFLTPPIAQRRQPARVAVTGHDGPDDRHACRAIEFGDGAMDADIHLVQALLHPAKPLTPLGDERAFVPDERAQQTDLLDRTKGAAQEATAVQTLNPFTVAAIGFWAPGDAAQFARIHEDDLQACPFEHLVRHNPVHARALERDRRHAALLQPCGHLLHARCGRRKDGHFAAHARPRWRTDPVVLAPNIDPSHVRAQHREALHAVTLNSVPAVLVAHRSPPRGCWSRTRPPGWACVLTLV